jgi:large subunit ribosomal protein L35
MKSHKGVRKRFKLTGTGKVKRTQACHQKYSIKKSGTKLQKMRKTVLVSPAEAPRIKRLMQG